MRKTITVLCALALASPLAGCDRDANEEMPGLRTADEREETIEERTENTQELAGERREQLEEVRDEQLGVVEDQRVVEDERVEGGRMIDDEQVNVERTRVERGMGADDDGEGAIRGDAARRRARIENIGAEGEDEGEGALRRDAARRRARIESIAQDARMENERVAVEAQAAQE